MTTATHSTLLYDGARQYADEVGGVLRHALGQGHRGLVMAPARRVDELRSSLGRDADEVTFVEDTVAYAPQWNAYRVLIDFASAAPGVRTCAVAEQTLLARTPAELVDYQRLEAAINIVFADSDVDLLCPYDAGTLPAHLLDIARHTHDAMRGGGARCHPMRAMTNLSPCWSACPPWPLRHATPSPSTARPRPMSPARGGWCAASAPTSDSTRTWSPTWLSRSPRC